MANADSPDQSPPAPIDNHQYRRLVEAVTDYAIFMLDPDGVVSSWNPGAERFKGYGSEEIVGQHFSRFYSSEDQANGAPQQALDFAALDGRFESQGWRIRKDGSRFWADVTINAIRANDGSLLGFTKVTRDITGRMETQSKIDEANVRLATLNEELELRIDKRARELERVNASLIAASETQLLLAREVDHRAKNALAVVQAVVSLTRSSTKEEFVAAVRGRVSALARAHSVLADNRWEGGDLAQIIAEETAPYLRPGQLRATGPSIRLEPSAVQPISLLIHELATNAVKYGSLGAENGHVDVEFAILPGQALSLSWRETGGPPVIPPKVKGFGSTLISEVTRRQLGGTLEIEWLLPGMQLTAVLPARVYRHDSAPNGQSTPPTNVVPLSPAVAGRVLVVEDESLIALELCEILTDAGWVVVGPAESVSEASRLLDASPPIDVAVLDVNLNGSLVYALAERLESDGVPFVFCTGYAQLHDDRYRNRPIVRKPISAHKLVEELRRAVGRLAA